MEWNYAFRIGGHDCVDLGEVSSKLEGVVNADIFGSRGCGSVNDKYKVCSCINIRVTVIIVNPRCLSVSFKASLPIEHIIDNSSDIATLSNLTTCVIRRSATLAVRNPSPR